MSLNPINDRVVVKLKNTNIEKKLKGIIMPETINELIVEGEVIAVGPGFLKDDGSYRQLDVVVGDNVMFHKASGTKVKINNIDYVIITESNIFGTIN